MRRNTDKPVQPWLLHSMCEILNWYYKYKPPEHIEFIHAPDGYWTYRLPILESLSFRYGNDGSYNLPKTIEIRLNKLAHRRQKIYHIGFYDDYKTNKHICVWREDKPYAP